MLDFFNDMDHNRDGYITFDEWRYVNLCLSLPSVMDDAMQTCFSIYAFFGGVISKLYQLHPSDGGLQLVICPIEPLA